MTVTTGKVLLAASNKTETEALTRVEISAGRTAIRPVVSTKARHAILGRIKTRTVGIATVQTAKTTAKETVTQTDSEAASRAITQSYLTKEKPAAQATGFFIPATSPSPESALTPRPPPAVLFISSPAIAPSLDLERTRSSLAVRHMAAATIRLQAFHVCCSLVEIIC
jgi:hypothetical protein